MPDETVETTEAQLLRRIHPQQYDLQNPNKPREKAFYPNDKDVDGISVTRQSLAGVKECIGEGGRKKTPEIYFVCALPERIVESAKGTIVPSPVHEPPECRNIGHAHIPETRWQCLQSPGADKEKALVVIRAMREACRYIHRAGDPLV